ncbi:MAG: hypothetical protein JO187_10230 [Acidobacteria bacterium]|nr:hypothetical protein [Acidobacteriota bacterium]
MKYGKEGHVETAAVGSDRHGFGSEPIVAIFEGAEGKHFVCTQERGSPEGKTHKIDRQAVIDVEEFSALA